MNTKLDVRVTPELLAEIKAIQGIASYSAVVRRLIELGLEVAKADTRKLFDGK